MPIDTLVIDYSSQRGSRFNNDLMSDPDRIDFQEVFESLNMHGYEPSTPYYGNNSVKTTVQGSDGRDSLRISARGNGDYAYVTKIECSPLHFGVWGNFRQIIDAMAPSEDETVASRRNQLMGGRIKRIDYACDYAVDIQTIMKGLYVDRAQSFYAFVDMDDNHYVEYFWERGTFNSFRIGKKNKTIKIYDKRLEEIKRLERRHRQTLIEEYQRDNPDSAWEDDGDISEAVERQRQESLDRLRSLPPKTRIEVSLNDTNTINRIWGRSSRNGDSMPAPILGELEDHMNMIQARQCFPFAGILLNDVSWRNSERRGRCFDIRSSEARKIQGQIESGLFFNLVRQWGQNFWAEHERYFEIRHWNPVYQPSLVYASRMQRWLRPMLSVPFDEEGAAGGRDWLLRNSHPVTGRWPMDLSIPFMRSFY